MEITWPQIEESQPRIVSSLADDGMMRLRVESEFRIVTLAGLYPMVTLPCHDEPRPAT